MHEEPKNTTKIFSKTELKTRNAAPKKKGQVGRYVAFFSLRRPCCLFTLLLLFFFKWHFFM
jgi:hypothetical protein